MITKYRLPIIFFIFVLFATSTSYVIAGATNTIKIALLDSPYNEMPLVPMMSEYEKAYFAGVETAAKAAKKYKIEIEYKSFMYGNGSLDILGEIPKLQKWQANLVIGPNSSDQFLMLGNYLPDVMVLSAYASGDALQTLPKNFYSTFLPDAEIMKLLGKFIKESLPNKNLYLIVQADCKQCVDVAKIFSSGYKKISPTSKIVENKLIMDNIRSIDSKKLMARHTDDVVLVFNDSYYSYNTFVNHVASSFPNRRLIFISDQDNWSHEVDGNSHNLDLSYDSYRIGPILFDTSSEEFKIFSQQYYDIHRAKPSEAISYLAYVAVMSAVKALQEFPPPASKKSMQEKILYSYLTALSKHPNWFRSRAYGIYRMTSSGEVLVKKLPAPKLT